MAADDDSPLQLWLRPRPRPPDNRCPSPSPPSSSSSSSTSSSSISSHHRQPTAQCAAAPMTDLDAARALADFAHMALLERGDAGRGSSRRRSSSTRKRAGYHEAGDGGGGAEASGGGGARMDDNGQEGGRHRHGPRPLALDLNQNAIPSPSEDQNASSGSIPEEHPPGPHAFSDQTLQIEPAGGGGVRLPFGAGPRVKQSHSEADKEAKRLRRILANRESARQTIRRRQALREELTRKADSLSQENDNMKKEKELLVKEYKLLKGINNRLKDEMAERLKHKTQKYPQPMPEQATADVAGHPRQPFSTPPSGRHAAAAPPLQQQQLRFPPLVPFAAWPTPHLQVVSPFSLVRIEPNSKTLSLGCCYDQAAAAEPALYVPPPTAYPALFHNHHPLPFIHQEQHQSGKACPVEGVGENPDHTPPPTVDNVGGADSWRTPPRAEPKAKAKLVAEKPPRCSRPTTAHPEPKGKANAALDRSSGKVFPLAVPEASSSSSKNEHHRTMTPGKTPLLLGTATEQSRKHHHQHCLAPAFNEKVVVPAPSVLPAGNAAAREHNPQQDNRAASDEAVVERRHKEAREHLTKKAMDAAAARKRRRELTKLKMQYQQQRWRI